MRNRIALVAGLLALGVAACGDDVQVVEPTPPQPPPPPPVTATMAPASAEVAVGGSVVFAVNASGGVAGEAASWTCASSNTGIATVSVVSAGCQATGVAAGGVTITAAVTKSGESVNVGAQLTVTSDEEPPQPPGDPAFLVVAGIAGEDGTDASGLQGRVSVTVDVERGDQELEMLSLLVDGAVVESQSFGGGMDMGMTPPADEAAEQAVHAFTLAFDSHDYDRESGAPTYTNGEHTISAELEIGVDMADGTHGHETVSSNAVTVDFDNDDFIAASFSGLGDGAMNEETGQIWYGGPDASVEITALPVLYSSGAVSSLTLFSFCGDDAATDSEAPFSFSLDCDETSGEDGDKPKFTVEGTDINVRAKAVYLDFEGPAAPHFNVNPNGREDGWVNGAVDFLGKFHKDRNKDGWLVYNDDEEGVGGYDPQLRYSSTTPSIVDGAREATANVLPTEPTKADAVCVIATAKDILGNESKLPSAGSACAKAADYTADDDDDYPAGLRAGLDITAPTIEFTPNSLKADSRTLDRAYDLRVKDEKNGSGLHSMPVLARVAVRDAKETTCGDDEDGLPGYEDLREECKNNTEGIGELADDRVLTTLHDVKEDDGYYTFTALAQDKAGNKSAEISRVALHDDTDPLVSVGITTGAKKGDLDHNLVGTVTDALSIRDYSIAAQVGEVFYGLEARSPVDAYNADELTTSVPLDEAVTLPFLGVQEGTDDPVEVSMLRVSARDQAGNIEKDADPVAIAADLSKSKFADMAFVVEPDDDAESSTLTIRAEVTSDDNPFTSVIFYAAAADDTDDMDLRFIASVPEYSARRSGDKWAYTARVSADDFYAAVDGDGDYSGNVYAVGVGAAGSVAGAEIKTTTKVTTTTAEGTGRQEVTTDADGRTTSTVNIYTAEDVTDLDVMVDTDVATDDAADDDDIKDNDFTTTLSTGILPADDTSPMPSVRAQVTIMTLATDDKGTVATGDDVTTRTTVTESTVVTLTAAAVAQVGMAAVTADADANRAAAPASDDYKASVPAKGTIQTTTTTDILVGRPGATIDRTTAVGAAAVEREVKGSPVAGEKLDVEIPSAANADPDAATGTAPTGVVTDLETADTFVAKAGDTTTTIETAELTVEVSTTTSTPGESTDNEGGVGLKSVAGVQKVDER